MRLIDADKLKFVPAPIAPILVGDETHWETIILKDRIDAAPTVDAVPVIRCRDCKFLRFTGTVWKCQNRLVMMLCEPNDYCSRAERKEE